MDWIEISVAGRRWRAGPDSVDLAIPLDFGGPQPRFFSDAPASAAPLAAGEFNGEVRRGASCNCSILTFAPHCHGTHTECVGHITEDRHTLADLPPEPLRLALLVSVGADVPAITRAMLVAAAEPWEELPWTALIVRSLPNNPDKKFRHYEGPIPAPYFTAEAMAWVVEHEVASLVVDLPSLDRGDDPGLAAHRAYWGLPAASRQSADARRANALVTELAYVPDRALDGLYLLELQVPVFMSDAAPSRPVIRAAVEMDS